MKENDHVYAIILGDLLNNSTKTSVGDVYEEELTPMQQVKKAVMMFEPIKHKILGVCSGNHERRSYKMDGVDLLYFMCAELGIADKFHFTGFLRGDDVKKMFAYSDVYIMPSVSEPFGISPLEAMKSNVPSIISKQSGVAEVLDYAIKTDFWDIDAMADAIYGLLKYPALASMSAKCGVEEVNNLKWENAALKMIDVYQEAIDNLK